MRLLQRPQADSGARRARVQGLRRGAVMALTARRHTMTAYKVLGTRQESHHSGTGRWVKNRWRTVDGPLIPCENGIHYCRRDQLVRWLGPTIWLFEDGTPDETLDAGDKMVTRKGRIVERVETWNETTVRLFAADCAETVFHLIPAGHRDPFVAAIGAARGFARGEISDRELAAARDAAWAAAGAAAGAAARDAAWAAAGAAARAAAGAAARDAAWAAARDAAGAAAAAGDAQTEILFDYLEGRRS